MKTTMVAVVIGLGATWVAAQGAPPPPEAKKAEGQDAPKKPESATRIAVVDLKKCFEKSKVEMMKEVDAEFEKARASHQADISQAEKKRGEILDQIRGLPDRSTTLYQEKFKEYKMAELNLDMVKKIGQTRLLDKYGELMQKVYNEVRAAVSKIAEADGYDLVLRVEAPQLEEDTSNPETVGQRIASRVVLHASDKLDITGRVIERMNQEYEKKKAEKPK
jgi:Skp family chaperone for outer membrane proteins